MTAHHAAAWTVRGRLDDVISSVRSSLATWLSGFIARYDLGEAHDDFFPMPAVTPVTADRRLGESGSDAATVVAAASRAAVATFNPRSSLEHVNWGR